MPNDKQKDSLRKLHKELVQSTLDKVEENELYVVPGTGNGLEVAYGNLSDEEEPCYEEMYTWEARSRVKQAAESVNEMWAALEDHSKQLEMSVGMANTLMACYPNPVEKEYFLSLLEEAIVEHLF